MNSRETLNINSRGQLEIGGVNALDLVKKFGTPLYVYDEQHIRKMLQTFISTLKTEYDSKGTVAYASKAFSCKSIYALAKQEGASVDVVSGGELYTALQANFPPQKIFMHGNNKTIDELNFAIQSKVGVIVLDSYREADILNDICTTQNVKQNVIIRVNPGVEAHTHTFIQTARTDSKFGFAISDKTAHEFTKYVLDKSNLVLKGFHCHIGSQIFEKQSFVLAATKMLDYINEIKNTLNFETEYLNMGGGFGIWYTDEDPKLTYLDYEDYLKSLIVEIKRKAQEHSLKLPYLIIEPGRSIVGEAGVTLYTVGSIKEIKGIKKYVTVDGGMFEAPRYALYQAKYTALLANKACEPNTEIVTIAGKCCESGDIIAANVQLPKAESGDILAVLSTGAYHYSMASNYNRNLVPPVIFVKDGKAEYVVKPQTYEDIVRNDVFSENLK